jgi:hypothetical protein
MFMRGVWLEQCTLLAAMRFIGALGHEGFARAAGTCSGLWQWRTARGQRCAQVSIVHGLRRALGYRNPKSVHIGACGCCTIHHVAETAVGTLHSDWFVRSRVNSSLAVLIRATLSARWAQYLGVSHAPSAGQVRGRG